ncbi:hypothetical protein [Deinococcus humi]|uniref:Uncharacterized protein n=1 Tax=Deinococcus humi TaxID=662880 RepID=A0A7W8NHA9_9DEIO|nr:hypothetical protein [Deinococcus humi]MBB5366361.1 hypothetical protein [Deinococcus humi]GGO41450.1 hypothetical protein GCM10008949_52290 [Deinococcus humi]
MGTTLPVHDRLGAFGAGEAVLSLAYLAAAAARGISEPPAVAGRWWTYTNANAILDTALRRFQQRGAPVLGSLPLEVLGKAFDQWEKAGSMVTFKAEYFPPAPQA